MLQGVQAFTRVCVPDFPFKWFSGNISWQERTVGLTYAEKSAAAVAAMLASAERRACQTAPLWPINVPILGSKLTAGVFNFNLILFYFIFFLEGEARQTSHPLHHHEASDCCLIFTD